MKTHASRLLTKLTPATALVREGATRVFSVAAWQYAFPQVRALAASQMTLLSFAVETPEGAGVLRTFADPVDEPCFAKGIEAPERRGLRQSQAVCDVAS